MVLNNVHLTRISACICVHVCLLNRYFEVVCSKPTGSSEKKTMMKKRREKRKLMKKNCLMSELPFALTSPTAWKELGCMSFLLLLCRETLNYTFEGSDLLTDKVVCQPSS